MEKYSEIYDKVIISIALWTGIQTLDPTNNAIIQGTKETAIHTLEQCERHTEEKPELRRILYMLRKQLSEENADIETEDVREKLLLLKAECRQLDKEDT